MHISSDPDLFDSFSFFVYLHVIMFTNHFFWICRKLTNFTWILNITFSFKLCTCTKISMGKSIQIWRFKKKYQLYTKLCNLLDIHLFLMNFRLTLHTVEDLQRELELKASMADKTARPNTPDWMSSIDPNAPLIYSPRVPPVTPPETPKTKVGSSLIKIKFNFFKRTLFKY